MEIATSSGHLIRGDMVIQAIQRLDLVPVPSTFEAIIRADSGVSAELAEGKRISANGAMYQIIKSSSKSSRAAQGENSVDSVEIIAVLDACRPIIYRRERAVVKENALLTEIYRACGAQINAVENDFVIPRFYCYHGDTPSMQIAKVLQENGGVIRYRDGRIAFTRIDDLFGQSVAMSIPDNAAEGVQSEFLKRHEIPNYYSIAPDGGVIFGSTDKTRKTQFVANKNQQQLIAMSKCLVRRKISKVSYLPRLQAGDLFDVGGRNLVAIAAAHVLEPNNQYTRLWLADIER